MDELELNQCPFCGGRAVIDVDRDEECFLAHVFCTNYEVKDGHCHCEMKYWAESAEKARCDAVNAWNNRSDDEIYIEALDRVAGKWALDELNRTAGKLVQADAENAELRELVRDMWRFTGTACKKYPKLFDPSAQGGQMVYLNQIDSFEQRMRELGIEVQE